MSTLKDWCKEVEVNLFRLNQIPAIENAPHFPWEDCEAIFQKNLQLDSFSLSASPWEWVDLPPTSFATCLTLSVAPLDAPAYWLTDADEFAQFSLFLLGGEEALKGEKVVGTDVLKAFQHYLFIAGIQSVCTFPSLKGLHPSIEKEGEEHLSGAFLSSFIQLQVAEQTLQARLLLPERLVEKINRHFPSYKASPQSLEVAETTPLTLHIEVGHASLTSDELSSIEEGDFLRLDQCFVDPTNFKGSATISCNGMQLFRGKLEAESLTILGPDQ